MLQEGLARQRHKLAQPEGALLQAAAAAKEEVDAGMGASPSEEDENDDGGSGSGRGRSRMSEGEEEEGGRPMRREREMLVDEKEKGKEGRGAADGDGMLAAWGGSKPAKGRPGIAAAASLQSIVEGAGPACQAAVGTPIPRYTPLSPPPAQRQRRRAQPLEVQPPSLRARFFPY